ncbi:MAG: DNA polymerase III subunit beta [Clostridia bacterium]|nr:DNA polymerase III subunit beta [Clostridia bacterium]
MKFKCNQQTLSKALNIVSKAVTNKTTLPIMKGIMLKVDENGILTMSASDFYISVEKSLKVEDFLPGSIVVMSKLFGDIVRKLPNDDVYFELVDNYVVIKCQNTEFKILGLSSDEFPVLNKVENNNEVIKLDRQLLIDMIKRTAFAASIDEAKGVITGVLLEMGPEKFNMVALDGYRMAISRERVDINEEKKIVIPAKIIGELNKILLETADEEYDVNMIITEKKVVFIMDNTKVILNLLEGEFIKYQDILPKDNTTTVVLNKNDLAKCIERASLLAKEGKNNLIKFSITENNILITSKSEEGNVKENLSVYKEGNDLEIGFNSKYILDVLKVIDDEDIKMEFKQSINPCIVKPIEGNVYEYLVLPVRITTN